MKSIFSVLIGFLTITYANNGHATSLEPFMGSRAYALGGNAVGLADDIVSALYYNPGGLNEIKGQKAAFFLFFIKNHSQYQGKDQYQGYNERSSRDAFLPFMGYSLNNGGNLALGLGVSSTQGCGYEFIKDPAHGVMHDFKNSTGVMTVSPTVSYKFHPKLTVGAQANIGYAKSEIKMPTPAGYLKTDSDGFGYGGTIGLLYKPFSFLNVGLSWHSSMKTPLDGDVELYASGGIENDSLDFDLYWPQKISFGICLKLKENLIIPVSLTWTDWTHFGKSKLKYEKLSQFNGLLLPELENTFQCGIGMEYHLKSWIDLRCGYAWHPHALKAKSVTPLLPEMACHSIMMGLGIKLQRFQIDIGYGHAFSKKREINEGLYPGTYTGYFPVGSIEISYDF